MSKQLEETTEVLKSVRDMIKMAQSDREIIGEFMGEVIKMIHSGAIKLQFDTTRIEELYGEFNDPQRPEWTEGFT